MQAEQQNSLNSVRYKVNSHFISLVNWCKWYDDAYILCIFHCIRLRRSKDSELIDFDET